MARVFFFRVSEYEIRNKICRVAQANPISRDKIRHKTTSTLRKRKACSASKRHRGTDRTQKRQLYIRSWFYTGNISRTTPTLPSCRPTCRACVVFFMIFKTKTESFVGPQPRNKIYVNGDMLTIAPQPLVLTIIPPLPPCLPLSFPPFVFRLFTSTS